MVFPPVYQLRSLYLPAFFFTSSKISWISSTEQTRKFLSHIFKGKASLLVNHLVSSGDLTVEEIQEILDEVKKNAGK